MNGLLLRENTLSVAVKYLHVKTWMHSLSEVLVCFFTFMPWIYENVCPINFMFALF